jgi:hypothetical protein
VAVNAGKQHVNKVPLASPALKRKE